MFKRGQKVLLLKDLGDPYNLIYKVGDKFVVREQTFLSGEKYLTVAGFIIKRIDIEDNSYDFWGGHFKPIFFPKLKRRPLK